MSDLLIDQLTGDLVIDGESGINLTEDTAQALAQRLKIKLQTFEGEYFLDTLAGVPYYQTVFVKGSGKALVDSVFKFEIADIPDVISITSFGSNLDAATRTYSMSFSVRDSNNQIVEVSL